MNPAEERTEVNRRQIQIEGAFADAIEAGVMSRVGEGQLSQYTWANVDDDDDDDDGYPIVIEDLAGRRYEVGIDVSVIELTADVLAYRAALAERLARLNGGTL